LRGEANGKGGKNNRKESSTNAKKEKKSEMINGERGEWRGQKNGGRD
jgi:hypothetical protein